MYEEDDDTLDPSAVPSFRRIWKRRDGSQGSSELALAAMAVLYDAGTPLTRGEIADRLWPRLDDYARAYLRAWDARRREQQRRWVRRRRQPQSDVVDSELTRTESTASDATLRHWLKQIFCRRIYGGQTLIRHPDGRYEPGPRAPILKTLEGERVRYTPEVRREVEQSDQQSGRLHLVQLEFKRAAATLSDQAPAARAQVLRFLVRQLHGGPSKGPLAGSELRRAFDHLLKVTDTRETQDALIRLITEWLLAG